AGRMGRGRLILTSSRRPVEPVVAKELARMLGADGAVAAGEIVSRTVLVASPADAFRMLRVLDTLHGRPLHQRSARPRRGVSRAPSGRYPPDSMTHPEWAPGVCAGLHAAGSRHVVYVPDNPLSHVLRLLRDQYADVQTTIATREEEAFGIAAGLYLGGAK